MPKRITDNCKEMIVEFYNRGYKETDIASKLDISCSSVFRTLQERGLKSTEPKANTNADVNKAISFNVSEINRKVDYIIGFLEEDEHDDEVYLSFDAIGFADRNGTFVNRDVKVSMNNRKIFYHYQNDRDNWNTAVIDPNVIEAIFNEMKLRGWNYFK